MLTLTAVIQEVPPDHRGGYHLACDEIVVVAETYEQGKEDVREIVAQRDADGGSGWRVISYSVERP